MSWSIFMLMINLITLLMIRWLDDQLALRIRSCWKILIILMKMMNYDYMIHMNFFSAFTHGKFIFAFTCDSFSFLSQILSIFMRIVSRFTFTMLRCNEQAATWYELFSSFIFYFYTRLHSNSRFEFIFATIFLSSIDHLSLSLSLLEFIFLHVTWSIYVS